MVGVLGLVGTPAFAAVSHHPHHHRHTVAPLSADDPGLKSAAAYVEDDGNVSKVGADGAQLSEFRNKARGQIVDAKIAQVFQTFGGLALAGA